MSSPRLRGLSAAMARVRSVAAGRAGVVLSAAAILALAAFLRFYDLAGESLWLDESYSWWDAHQSFSDLWSLVPQCDPHPPLYFVLLKLWMYLFGDSAFALRSLGALVSMATVGCVIAAGRQINARTGWIAGLLFATAPFQIEFAREARPYALFSLGAALIAYGVLRLLHAPFTDARSGRRAWVALIAGGIIAVWSDNTAMLLLAALASGVGLLSWFDRGGRVRATHFAIALALIGIAWLPYVPVFIEQARGIATDFWIPRPDAFRFANELRVTLAMTSFPVLACMAVLWAAGLVLLVRAQRWRASLVLAALGLLPALYSFAVSQIATPVYLARALIDIAPAFVIAVAAALALLPQRATAVTLVAVFAAVQVFDATKFYADSPRKPPWNDIAREVAVAESRGALVLTEPNEMTLPLAHALAANGVRGQLHGAPVDFPAPGIRARYPSGKCAPSLVGFDLAALVHRVGGRSAVVVITRDHNTYDPDSRLRGLLLHLGFRQIRAQKFHPGALLVMEFEKHVQPRAAVVRR